MHVQSPARHSSPAGRWDVGRRSVVAPGRWKSTGSHRSALISLFEPNPGTERRAPKEFHGMCRRIDATRVKAIPLHDGIVFEALIVCLFRSPDKVDAPPHPHPLVPGAHVDVFARHEPLIDDDAVRLPLV